ncbi:methyltransferase domain-containing protein [Methylophaga sp. OBS4]|uniref:methyltransferase domain-containing protein n=1 Tax=Methylophaga sp. OBS4 TaxID=2991935 RepID=UPI002253112E|nr:methyltransferase domain-containing protein [Methylophaga sp. OBS4]MCX4186713.1 methyltransferase domain-containing protein [Methylophaga sp. OBS4]
MVTGSKQDRNFDDLADRFEQKIYNTVKGDWRLTLLQQDLAFLHQQSLLNIWDAGCGQAQISQWFAEQGHALTLCDLSGKMLQRAQNNFAAAGLSARFYHQSAQSLASELPEFDLVLCHAVLEWLAQPLPSLFTIADKVRPGGYLSLLFYNRNAMVYSNVLKGGWRLKPILDDSYIGQGNKLTPPNPQFPHEVIAAMTARHFSVKTHTGVRVFNDYLSTEAKQNSDEQELFALEKRYCRMPTYRDMGRYVHVLFQREETAKPGDTTLKEY